MAHEHEGLFRLKKLKGGGHVFVAARHNRRAIAAERGAQGSIDASRSALNYCLEGPATPEAVNEMAARLMDAA